MGVTGPIYKDVNFYYPFYLNFSFCFNTCLTCDYRGNEEVQNCTSCYNDSLLQEDLGNCVESCPNGTILDEDNYICNDNKNNKKNKDQKNNLKYYIIVPIASILLIAIIVIIILIARKKKIKKFI